ncbi:helix-turn-helix domain-containing protein [Flavobacteriaceae bacterium F89]|uniref:Helix-turn-helix domain-containing protein n=1 Tax=Cerina litoralis TaxID=2874477 RepID=A0AAE3EWC5_9FLAO|nr:helix-turn-helix transcriptional regulator [Cerina litoralis]MCG2461349.1 helix-turn-helix domain-containing protein [Cerina litoralis]
MINTELLIKRLEKIIQFHNMSASQFADRIGVQRSSISHLLTGRNKPSLEFVMKLVTEFPEVNLYWLLYGQGSFPDEKIKNGPTSLNKNIKNKDNHSPDSKEKPIKKVIIFYKDGSFDAYDNDKS